MQQILIINRLYSVVCHLSSVFRLLSSVFCLLRSSTSVEDSLQIGPFMQNKPNFRKSQMNVNSYNTTDYENISDWTIGQNKPNSNPIYQRVKLMQSVYLQRIMKKMRLRAMKKQSQYKPNSRKPKNEIKLLFYKGL